MLATIQVASADSSPGRYMTCISWFCAAQKFMRDTNSLHSRLSNGRCWLLVLSACTMMIRRSYRRASCTTRSRMTLRVTWPGKLFCISLCSVVNMRPCPGAIIISASSASEVREDMPSDARADVKSRSMYSAMELRCEISFSKPRLVNMVEDRTKVRTGMGVGNDGRCIGVELVALPTSFSFSV